MATALRTTARRLATSTRRSAVAEVTTAYEKPGKSVNAYGIGVSKAQGVVDGLTGGELAKISETLENPVSEALRWYHC